MTGFKITKKDGYYAYEAPGHKECKLTRLHDPAANPLESIYYIIKGKMLFKGDDGSETVLEEGDSVHIAPGSKKSVTNIGTETAQMLVVLLPPAQN